jgi:hypothetical protein
MLKMPKTPKMEILKLKKQLQDTDYKAIKYIEGWLTEEEYAETKAERQRIREEINRLEQEVQQQKPPNSEVL